jgi:hypothetical protein
MNRFAKLVVLRLLRAYKWGISPMLPPACRYVPTCSEYAMEAVERYGVLRGGAMAFMRVLRCHPLVSGGYDPVVKREFPGEGPLERGQVQPAPLEANSSTTLTSDHGAI